MSDYTRRPFAMGNTENELHNQPEIRGFQHKDADGNVPGLADILSAEIAVETEDGATVGGLSAVFTEESLEHVIEQINTVSGLKDYVEAEEYEGCLVLRTKGTGEGAYIRVMDPVSGFNDAAYVLGFPSYPNPSATVASGDLLDAPARPMQQSNPAGTKFLATGEDRSGSAYNRALHQLGINTDQLYTWAKKPIAKLFDAVVDHVTWSPYIVYNADGTVDQINLSAGLAAHYPAQTSRIFVGRLERSSTLEEIAQYFGVLDSEHNELMAKESTVRIGAVTRGQRGITRPTFVDEDTAPSPALSDTSGVSLDGNNALGVDRTKQAATQIDDVRQNTILFCENAQFKTNDVQPGDIATIAGSTIDVPFNHSGEYIVEVVVSEQELIVRPHHDSGHVQVLNGDESGDFGTVVITSGGEWEDDIWLTFEPPLPRMPGKDGKIRLIVPVETTLAGILPEAIAGADIRVYEEADGWVLYNLWQQQNFGGLYQGQNHDRGGGYRGEVTHRPITLVNRRTALPDSGASNRSSSAAASLDANTLCLTAGATDAFRLEDVGRTILLNASAFLDDEPWTITKFFDGATVEVAPPVFRTGYQDGVGVTVAITSWDIVEGDAFEVQAVLQMLSAEYYGDSDDVSSRAGIAYVREQRDQNTADDLVPGNLSFLHLEKVRHHDNGSKTNITVFTAPDISGATVEAPFDPEQSANIFATNGDTKTFFLQGGVTYLRILHGENRGLYQVKELTSSAGSGTDAFVVENLDGSTPTFAAESSINCCLYNARVVAGAQLFGGPEAIAHGNAALSLFEDAHASGALLSAALRLGWRGTGYGIVATLNDPEFIAHGNGDAAVGPLIFGKIYAPATGINLAVVGADDGADDRRAGYGLRIVVHTSLHDQDLNPMGAQGVRWHQNTEASNAAYFAQTGDDPGVLIAKHDEASSVTEDWGYSRVTPSVALGVMRARGDSPVPTSGPSGRGSAIESAGSIWVYRRLDPSENSSVFAEGGLFVEDTVGAGRWLYPMVGDYPDFRTYTRKEGLGGRGWEEPTQLGHSGQIIPLSYTETEPQAELQRADHARFNFYHEGMIYVADAPTAGFHPPYNRYIGTRVEVVELTNPRHGDVFTITGMVSPAKSEVYFALQGSGLVVSLLASGAIGIRVYGLRWHESHLDIGSYMQFGSSNEDLTLAEMPLLTVDADPWQEQVYLPPNPLIFVGNRDFWGFLSAPMWASAPDGVSIGNPDLDISNMPNTQVTVADYAAAETWENGTEDAEGPLFHHGWAEDAGEPRGPFPNTAATPKVDDSFYATDFIAEHIAGSAGNVSYATAFGGSLKISGSLGTTYRVSQRGRSFVLGKHLALKVHFRAAVDPGTLGNRTITVKLMENIDTVLATETVDISQADGLPHDGTVTLELNDLVDIPWDALQYSKKTRMVFVAIEVPIYSPLEAVYLLELRTENATKTIHLDAPMRVGGPVAAHGYRYTDQVRGSIPLGPADVKLLGGDDYGWSKGWPTYNKGVDGWDGAWTAGTQELRGTPGLVRMSSVSSYSQWEAALQAASYNANATAMDVWIEQLNDVVQAGYIASDPGIIPGYASALAELIEVYKDAALLEADLNDKRDLIDTAAGWALDIVRAADDAADYANSQGWGSQADHHEFYRDAIQGVLDTSPHVDPADQLNYALILSLKPRQNWIRPYVDQMRLFTQGVNSATVNLYNGAYDPLWYALSGDRIQNDWGDWNFNLFADSFVPCGMTGFLVPLDMPHGSVFSKVSVALSFRAHTESHFGIYRDMPDGLKQLGRDDRTSKTYDEVADQGDWDELEGCLVELWRFNAVDFDTPLDRHAAWEDHQAEFGFGERLAQWEIDLSEVDEPAADVNEVTSAWLTLNYGAIPGSESIRVGQEYFEKNSWAINASSSEDAAKFRVDRRQYTYTLVVRFFGGPRRPRSGSLYEPFTRGDTTGGAATPDSRWELPTAIVRQKHIQDYAAPELTEAQGIIYGYLDEGVYVTDQGNLQAPWGPTLAFPPQVKFRGARVDYLTDRGGHGGWGS